VKELVGGIVAVAVNVEVGVSVRRSGVMLRVGERGVSVK